MVDSTGGIAPSLALLYLNSIELLSEACILQETLKRDIGVYFESSSIEELTLLVAIMVFVLASVSRVLLAILRYLQQTR